MQRPDRMKTEPEFLHDVLERAQEISVAFPTEGAPYVVPLNFYAEGENIYIHTAPECLKFDMIRKNPQVGFCIYTDVRIDQKHSTTYYCSVIGSGSASIVTDPAEKALCLEGITRKFKSYCPVPAPAKMIERTGVFRIHIEKWTGKASYEKEYKE